MSGRTGLPNTPRLNARWALGVCTLAALLVGACSGGDSAVDLSTNSGPTPAPMVLESTTNAILDDDDSQVPPGSVPLLTEASPPADPPPQPTSGTGAQRDETVTVRLGERVEIAATGWAVRFAEVVEDSRCPIDVQCIWAGRVAVRLIVEHSDGRVAAMTLMIPRDTPTPGVFGDLAFEAQGIEPARHAGSPSPLSYVLHLRVSVS